MLEAKDESEGSAPESFAYERHDDIGMLKHGGRPKWFAKSGLAWYIIQQIDFNNGTTFILIIPKLLN